MKKLFQLCLFVFILVHGTDVPAQIDSTKCDYPEARQFDFWIGSWHIDQKIMKQDGSYLETKAHTVVTPVLNGCALEEHWKGDVKFYWAGMENIKPMQGLSLRYYDRTEKKWHISWLDNFNLELGEGFTGIFKNHTGTFFSERQTPGGKRISRIIFSDIKENSVHWDLAVSSNNGKNWTTIWIMEMARD